MTRIVVEYRHPLGISVFPLPDDAQRWLDEWGNRDGKVAPYIPRPAKKKKGRKK